MVAESTVTESRFLSGLQGSHEAFADLWKNHAKPHAQNYGTAVLTWTTWNAHRKAELRKAWHAVLGEIADTITFEDEKGRYRHSLTVWKAFFKERFIPGQSSEELTEDEYADLLMKTTAFACVELGMEFEERA